MRVALVASKSLGLAVLTELATIQGLEIALVTTPEEQKLRKKARELNVRYIQYLDTDKFDRNFAAYRVANFEPVVAFAAHWNHYLSAFFRTACGAGVLAYHPSLLPKHRGNDSVQKTVDAGDLIAGGTLYLMDDGYDTGPLVASRSAEEGGPFENASDLWREHLFGIGVELIHETVKRVLEGKRVELHRQCDQIHVGDLKL